MPNYYDIKLQKGGPDPATLHAHPGDKVKWTNAFSSGTVADFTLPTCVSPKEDPFSIAHGASTREFTVDNVKGSFKYHYEPPIGPTTGPESGTIDVSS